MERKIGEIFEYNGEWYQCIEGYNCKDCDLRNRICHRDTEIFPFNRCAGAYREDKKSVIFKKLEKVGEPLKIHNRLVLRVKADAYKCMNCCFYSKGKCELTMQECEHYDCGEENKFIEIKQNKEDMEEKKLNLKPFDIQKAREGKPVCTRDGRKARIICFDRRGDKFPIVALLDGCNEEHSEVAETFTNEGLYEIGEKSSNDLMMLPEKKEGWVNVYKERIYSTKEEAIEATYDGVTYVDTIKISWEE